VVKSVKGQRVVYNVIFFGNLSNHGLEKQFIGKITKLSNLAGLQVNNRPYFILLGAFEDELGKLSDLLNDFDGIVCHRRLFNIQEIQFKGGDDSDILYRKDDIPLRDYCPPIFLCDLINSEPKSIVGFLCMREDFLLSVG